MRSTTCSPLPAAHARRTQESLAGYVDRLGHAHEIVVRPGSAGSTLVLDRDLATLGDWRLVAHLCADEAAENAALVCASYLDQVRRGTGRCRPMTRADLRTAPLADLDFEDEAPPSDQLEDRVGRRYRLAPLRTALSIPELRWQRLSAPAFEPGTVSTRDVIASLESYAPVRALAARALAQASEREVSTAVLRAEIARVQVSPIVLNRRLREATLARVRREGLSLSEIAARCGRVKHDAAGNESGETSWLARRLGLLPEGGKDAPTPWIHTDVLALIARRGLGLSPHEVEVD